MGWFDSIGLDSIGDSVGGLFSGIGDFAEGVGSVGSTAANTAGRVLNAVQDVSSAFNSETLTQSQSDNQAKGISAYLSNNAVLVGGLVIGGVIITALLLRK